MNSRGTVGMFTTDVSLVVQSWDGWMAEATGLAESAACGEPLARLFPDLASRGLLARLRRVADGAGVEVLAPAFHKYLIPCSPRDSSSRFERMRQHVTIAPLRERGGVAGLTVTIEDVTERFDRDWRLTADLDSHDEAIRLHAAETLAAAGESPGLLAEALGDDSWRVRRVAVDGMAASGGREAVEKLVEALRVRHRDPALLNATISALAKTRQDVVMTVAALLDDADAEVRTYAALTLGLMADPRPVAALIARLGDTDTNVRFHAIEALGQIRESAAVDPLMAVAESRDFFLSFAALDALAAIGDQSIVPRLIALLDEDSLLPAVVACLGTLGTEEAAPPLARLIVRPGAPVAQIAVALADIYDCVQRQIGEGALVADIARKVMVEESAPTLIDALVNAGDQEARGLLIVLSWLSAEHVDETVASFLTRAGVRQVAAEALARRGVAAAPFVEGVAADASGDVKQLAAEALGRIGSHTSIPILIRWLDSESPVTMAATTALGAIGDPRAFEPLLAVLDHPEASVRQAAVAALNSIGHPRMEGAIALRLHNDSPRVRESAARIAGYFGYGSCLRQLVELCEDDEEIVRRAAVEHLANFDERAAWSKVREVLAGDCSATVRAAAARAMGQSTSEESLAGLIAACQDANLWVRYFAIRAIATQGTTHADALTCLAECATRDDAPPVRIAAIEGLAAAGTEVMLGVLLPLTRDLEPEVATAAVRALGAFESSTSESVLRLALDSGNSDMRRAALDAFGAQRPAGSVDTINAIADLVRHERDDALREDGIRALGRIGGSTAIAQLLDIAASRRNREPVIAALAGLDPADTRRLGECVASADESRRRLIVDALSRMKGPAVSAALAAALNDSSAGVRLAAARALGRLDLHDARAQLAAVARADKDSAVRDAAQDALTRG